MNAIVPARLETEAKGPGIFALVGAHWRDVAVVFALIAAIGIAYLHLAQRQYTVSATLAPSDAELNMLTGMSGISDLSSLSLGHIGLGLGSTDPKFSALLQQLTSSATATVLLSDDRVKAAIYDAAWDAQSRSFHPPIGLSSEIVQAVKSALGGNLWHPPTASDMQRYLSHNIVPKEIGISGLYSVSYSHNDPGFARYFLSRVLSISDNYLRQRKLARARAYVAYLDQKLKLVSDLDERQAMLKLRLQQENFLMAASVNLPFSADINDPPITPSRPTWPNLMIVGVIILFFGGGFAALVGAYFQPYEAIRRRFAKTTHDRRAITPSGPLRQTGS